MSELEAALARERGQNSSSGVEARELRVVVEELRRRMAEMEVSALLDFSYFHSYSLFCFYSSSYPRKVTAPWA